MLKMIQNGTHQKLTAFLIIFLLGVVCVKADSLTVQISCSSTINEINQNSWGVCSPDKYTWWPGNETLKMRIREANIKSVRVGPVQLGKYNGKDIYPSPLNWNWSDLDEILNTIWDAGAQPLFLVCGYPGGVEPKDWNAYATFMEGIVERYNVRKELGESKTILYWEMWNEPTIEGDGILSKEEFKTFVEVVGGKMKETDPSIKLVGPADAWANLNSDGYVAFTAKNLKSLIDVLSWHDYGPSPDNNDAARINWTKPHYRENILKGQTSFGKFSSAITEYHISHADGGIDYNNKYRNEFASTYMVSAIINAIYGNAELFTAYNLAETGGNLLGVLNNTDYSPYKPYYAFYLMGNYTGNKLLKASGSNSNIEYLVTKDAEKEKYYITVLNKSTNKTSCDLTFHLNELSSHAGNVIVRHLDANTNPTKIVTTFQYTGSSFSYSIGALSVVNFEVYPVMSTGKSNPTKKNQLMIYPNPVTGNTISLSINEPGLHKLSILDITGKYCIVRSFDNADGMPQTLDVSILKKGIYLAKISSKEENLTQLFIKE